jgi:hypothetical protein
MSGLQCRKRLWYEINQPAQRGPIGLTQQRITDQGDEVGRHARRRFPDGRLIEATGSRALKATQAAIAEGATCLFEAAFAFDDILIRCDILQRNPDHTWTLIEVKSSTSVKPEHYWDAAIQTYVLTGVGLEIRRVQLMYLNNQDCYHPDLSNLFVLQDMTAELTPLLRQVAHHKQGFLNILAAADAPEQPIGQHCHQPHPCPFKENCWHQVPQASIFTIPRLHWDKKTALIEQGIVAIADLPPTLKLSQTQQAYVETVQRNQPVIDRVAIAARLAELTYPIHFFDFETLNPAIPRFDGMKPHEHLPFQYSCHILHPDGRLEHHEYLQTETTDPRLPLIQALISHIGPVGSVVAYQTAFEASVLKKLAASFSQYHEPLLSICSRLWDQHDIFKYHYRHPAFLGKTSIKKVLPVVVPSLSYDCLEIRQGDEAQTVWEVMLQTTNAVHKQRLIDHLKAYCKLDTQAMLEIHQVLSRMEI